MRSITASIDRAREVLGYAPRYSTLDALHEALAWLVANGQADVGGQEFYGRQNARTAAAWLTATECVTHRVPSSRCSRKPVGSAT